MKNMRIETLRKRLKEYIEIRDKRWESGICNDCLKKTFELILELSK